MAGVGPLRWGTPVRRGWSAGTNGGTCSCLRPMRRGTRRSRKPWLNGLVCIGADRGFIPAHCCRTAAAFGSSRATGRSGGRHCRCHGAAGPAPGHGRRAALRAHRYSLEGLRAAIGELLSERWRLMFGTGRTRPRRSLRTSRMSPIGVMHLIDTLEVGGAEQMMSLATCAPRPVRAPPLHHPARGAARSCRRTGRGRLRLACRVRCRRAGTPGSIRAASRHPAAPCPQHRLFTPRPPRSFRPGPRSRGTTTSVGTSVSVDLGRTGR